MNRIWKSTGAVLLICLVFLSVASGCSQEEPEQTSSISGAVSDIVMPDSDAAPDFSQVLELPEDEISHGLEMIDSGYGYRWQSTERMNLLTYGEDALYGAMTQMAYMISDEQNDRGYYDMEMITLEDTYLTEDEIKIAITAFKNDHPQVFWIANVYGRAYQNDSTVVQLYSYVSPVECNRRIRELEAVVNEVIGAVGEGQSEFDRELAAFQFLADRCVYDWDTAASDENRKWESYTAYGTLVDGTGVCEGYSRAMQLLLQIMGMDCRLVNGQAGGVGHMWNLVKIGEDWYHLDATWNDQQEVVLYDYFNLTDEAIQTDHKIAPQLNDLTGDEIAQLMDTNQTYNSLLPVCESLQENYIRNCAIKISSFSAAEDRRVIEELQSLVKAQKPAAYFFISDEIDFNMAIQQMFKKKSPKIGAYIDGANKMYGIRKLDREAVRYIVNEDLRSITLILTYQ